MSLLRAQGLRPWWSEEGLDFELEHGDRLLVRGERHDLDLLFRHLSGRVTSEAGDLAIFGVPHPGEGIRERRWAARVALSRGELHLVENIDLVRNLTIPMVYALGIPERRARRLAAALLEEQGIADLGGRRPAEVPVHVRQLVHIARATTPGRDLTVLLDPQEGLLADDAQERLGLLLCDCPSAVLLCSEDWLAPPAGFEEFSLERPG